MTLEEFNSLQQGTEVETSTFKGRVYSVHYESMRVAITVATPLRRRGQRSRVNYQKVRIVKQEEAAPASCLTETAKENLKTAKVVLRQFSKSYLFTDAFTCEVQSESQADLESTMNCLTGSFEFTCEKVDYPGMFGYRLYLPRTDEALAELTA